MLIYLKKFIFIVAIGYFITFLNVLKKKVYFSRLPNKKKFNSSLPLLDPEIIKNWNFYNLQFEEYLKPESSKYLKIITG